MPKSRGWSWVVAALVLAATIVVPARAAHACSCAYASSVRDQLGAAPVAFIGHLTDRSKATDEDGDGFRSVVLTFDVIEPIKGTLGPTVEVRTGTGSGDCGLGALPDQVGLIAYRDPEGVLTAGICGSVHTVDDLRAAAAPMPGVAGDAVAVVGARYGPGRLVGLARDGAVVGVGEGDGQSQELALCAGGDALVELVSGDDGRLVQGRTTDGLALLGPSTVLGEQAQSAEGGMACLAPDASRVARLVDRGTPDGEHRVQALELVAGGATSTVELGPGPDAAFDAPRGELWLLAGTDDVGLERVDLTTMARTPLWHPAAGTRAVAVAADEREGRVAVLVGPDGPPPAPWAAYQRPVDAVVVLDGGGQVLATHPIRTVLGPRARWVAGTVVLQGTDAGSTPQAPGSVLVQVDPRRGEQPVDPGLDGTFYATELADGALVVPSWPGTRELGDRTLRITGPGGRSQEVPVDVTLTSGLLPLARPTAMSWPGGSAVTASVDPPPSTATPSPTTSPSPSPTSTTPAPTTSPPGTTATGHDVALGAPDDDGADGAGGSSAGLVVVVLGIVVLAAGGAGLLALARRRRPT